MGLVTLIALFFGNTPACEKLSSTPPPARLLSLASVLSIAGQLAIVTSFQVFRFSSLPLYLDLSILIVNDRDEVGLCRGSTLAYLARTFFLVVSAIPFAQFGGGEGDRRMSRLFP